MMGGVVIMGSTPYTAPHSVAWEEIYTHIANTVRKHYGWLPKEDQEDITQDAAEAFCKEVSKFDESRGVLVIHGIPHGKRGE